MNAFTEKVVAIIQAIPAGKVMTYGLVAAEAGSPRGARQVVRILHALSEKHNLPWHRVVNKKGEIAIPDEEGRYMQALYLRGEGVHVDGNGRIDLQRYLFVPGGSGPGLE